MGGKGKRRERGSVRERRDSKIGRRTSSVTVKTQNHLGHQRVRKQVKVVHQFLRNTTRETTKQQ